ncbi:MAG: hypothetical protein HGA45_07160 [Chloroflexales bacterium]|nr:hypothetical protein [Chloroflexales bacterium]
MRAWLLRQKPDGTLVTHATEHRAQIATIITQLGMEPPDLSVWLYRYTATVRRWI